MSDNSLPSAKKMPPKPAFKKPNFKRPNLALADPETSGSALDFFNRSKDLYISQSVPSEPPSKKTKKRKTSDSKPAGPVKADPDEPASSRPKAICVDSDSSDDDLVARLKRKESIARQKLLERQNQESGDDKAPRPSPAPRSIKSTQSPTPIPTASSSRPLPVRRRTSTLASRPALKSVPIELSDDEPEPEPKLPTPKPSTSTQAVQLSAEDQYWAEVDARAKARYQAERNSDGRSRVSASASADPPAPDSIVELLITSPIDNTDQLIIKARLSTAMKDVRKAWCNKQQFTEDQKKDIFLTFCGNRLFDFTKCRAIGFAVDDDGRLLSGASINESDPSSPKVHLEAVTQEIVEQRKREEEKKERKRQASEMSDGEEEAEDKGPEMRLILRARGLKEDFKIKVRPDTTVQKLINAFRQANSIGEDQHIRLDFEGDTLDPGDTIADTELEDMLPIDVHIKLAGG